MWAAPTQYERRTISSSTGPQPDTCTSMRGSSPKCTRAWGLAPSGERTVAESGRGSPRPAGPRPRPSPRRGGPSRSAARRPAPPRPPGPGPRRRWPQRCPASPPPGGHRSRRGACHRRPEGAWGRGRTALPAEGRAAVGGGGRRRVRPLATRDDSARRSARRMAGRPVRRGRTTPRPAPGRPARPTWCARSRPSRPVGGRWGAALGGGAPTLHLARRLPGLGQRLGHHPLAPGSSTATRAPVRGGVVGEAAVAQRHVRAHAPR